jgi:superfamily I DNA/RNA helicase
MSALSDEQQAIVDAPLEPMSVIACAGSGKTRTAVYRVIEMRRKLGEHRGRVALLSFSNIAVNTFRTDFRTLTDNVHDVRLGRVEIEWMASSLQTSFVRTLIGQWAVIERLFLSLEPNHSYRIGNLSS